MPASEAPTPIPRDSDTLRVRRGLFVVSLLALLFHVSRFAGDNMGLAAMSTAMAVVERGTVRIDDYADGLREVSWHDGHLYSGMPPGQSMVALPVYALTRPLLEPLAHALAPVMRQMPSGPGRLFDQPYMVRRILLMLVVLLLVACPLGAWVTVMMYDLGRAMVGDRPGTVSLALLLPFGTLWWTHASGGSARSFGAGLVLLALWWVVTMREQTPRPRRPWVLAGLGAAAGLAVATRYDMALMAAPVVVYAFVRIAGRERLGLVLGLGALLGLTGLYHYAAFGSPLVTPYQTKLTALPHVHGVFGGSIRGLTVVEHAGERMAVYDQNRREFQPANIYRYALGGQTALLRFTPALVLVLWGGVLLARRPGRRAREVGGVMALAVLGNFLAVSLLPFTGFMGSVGPRYMIPALPFLVLLMAPAWLRLGSRLRVALLLACFMPAYLAAMFAERVEGPLQLSLVARFGLSNYVMSRAQEAGVGLTPVISTVVCVAFWVALFAIGRRYLGAPDASAVRSACVAADD